MITAPVKPFGVEKVVSMPSGWLIDYGGSHGPESSIDLITPDGKRKTLLPNYEIFPNYPILGVSDGINVFGLNEQGEVVDKDSGCCILKNEIKYRTQLVFLLSEFVIGNFIGLNNEQDAAVIVMNKETKECKALCFSTNLFDCTSEFYYTSSTHVEFSYDEQTFLIWTDQKCNNFIIFDNPFIS